MAWVFILYAFFASVFTISKTGLDYTEPLFFMGTRMVAAGILMLAIEAFRDLTQFRISKKIVIPLLLLAFFNIYLTNACEFWGLKYLTSFKTCFIYSLSPFMAALLSFLIFREKMTRRKWGGLLIGCIGITPVLLNQSGSEQVAAQLLFFSWPEIAVVVAAIASVYGWILLRQLIKEHGVSIMFANGISMTLGGAVALYHSYLVEGWNPVPVTEVLPFIECTALLIVVSNFICYNLYGSLLKKFSATFLSFAGFTTPLFTALFGWWFLGEVITWPFYLSMGIVFVGLFIFYQEELQTESYRITPPSQA